MRFVLSNYGRFSGSRSVLLGTTNHTYSKKNAASTRRRIIFFMILALLGLFLVLNYTFFGRQKQRRDDRLIVHFGYSGKESCARHGDEWRHRNQPVRIFDAFIFNNELDLLEVRLNELYPYVDHFVIVESTRTFTNKPKPLYFENNKQRYTQFLDKVHHVVITDDEVSEMTSAWDIEEHSRRVIVRGLTELQVQKEDLVIISDTDEIPRGSVVELLKNCEGFPTPIAFRSRFYYYSFEWRYKEAPGEICGQSLHPIMYKYSDMSKVKDFRGGHKAIIDDAGWHCSWCFRDIASYIHKMESYSHTEHDRKKYKSPQYIKEHIENGIDLFERWGEEYVQQTSIVGLPEFVVKNQDRFGYLLPRGSKYRV